MTQRRQWRRSVILGSLAVFAVAGCAGMEKKDAGMETKKMSATDAIAERQRLMKLNGALWRDAQDKAKAGQFEAIAVDAEAMAFNAPMIPTLFPEGSLSDKSAAKPEIWQKWPEFETSTKNFQAWSEKLRDAARSKNADATQAVMRDFGKMACGSCHTPFRVPPKQ